MGDEEDSCPEDGERVRKRARLPLLVRGTAVQFEARWLRRQCSSAGQNADSSQFDERTIGETNLGHLLKVLVLGVVSTAHHKDNRLLERSGLPGDAARGTHLDLVDE
jgi:hypothetical protein